MTLSLARQTSRPPAALRVAAAEFIADLAGALFWPQERLLIVADLHLEKGSAYAARGVFLPPYDTRATLEALARLVAVYRPRAVAALGDSFHDGGAGARLTMEDRARIRALQAGRAWIWIAGNHDRDLHDRDLPDGLGGEVCAELAIGGLILRHEPRPGPSVGEIAGHLHPVAKVAGRAGSVRRRSFVGDGARCVLPAFGAFAGGLNIRDKAFAPLFGRGGSDGEACAQAIAPVMSQAMAPVMSQAMAPVMAPVMAHVMGRAEVHLVPRRRCLPD